jgi:TonB family protein
MFTMTVTAVVAEDTTAVHRIPTADAMKAVKFKIQPEYPAIARQLRVGGTVDVDVLINSTGEVDKVTLLDGDALLAKSVISAVKKWKFSLTAAGTGPPPIVTRLTFRFEP